MTFCEINKIYSVENNDMEFVYCVNINSLNIKLC